MILMEKGSIHSAVIPITVQPAGLDCQVELWLTSDGATKNATSGLISFVSSGTIQNVTLDITMPGVWGDYAVFIDVYADSAVIGQYVATERIGIAEADIGEPTWE